MMFRGWWFACCVLAVLDSVCDWSLADDSQPALFESKVQAIFRAKCSECHGAKQRKSGLDLSQASGVFRGGESGAVIEPGQPDDSLLFDLIRDGEMPPKGKTKLTKAEIASIRQWIADGAKSKAGGPKVQRITQHQVIPLMLLRCTACHGAQRKEAGLDLRTKASMLKGGKSGPAVVPGKPEASLLVKRIRAEEMPPRRQLVRVSVKPMEAHEVKMLEAWIKDGLPESDVKPDVATTGGDPLISAEDRRFWSFQPPRSLAVPSFKDSALRDQIRNPIDAFILRKLRSVGLGFSPAAGPATLLRRIHFDLSGLPASLETQHEFLSDNRPGGYERLVDQLLASPRHGERWGRYWLDVAGYADSEGAQNEDRVRQHMWRYRDYVIRAFDSDKPYDRFLHEQLAGDELADYEHAKVITDEIYDNLVATGFLRTAPDRTFAGITNFVPDRLEVIADEMQILGSAVLGLTVNCARCHTHKFDPIPQRDYYRLLATFKDAFDEHDWLKPRNLPYVSTAERTAWLSHNNSIQEQIGKLQEQKKQLDEQAKMKDATEATKKAVAVKHKAIDAQIKSLNGRKKPEPRIRALWSQGRPSPTYLLKRGNYLTPGQEVGPGVPSILAAENSTFEFSAPWKGAKQTGRRLAFARWLTQPGHPLTARVIVNRVWKHHFGTGLVKTLDNFGTTGSPPSHPELLDWLAIEFQRQGWSLKALHRLIVTSTTYRQSSRVTAIHERLDADNRLLSRMPLTRMHGEVIRDSVLQLAGALDQVRYGSPDGLDETSQGMVTSRSTERGWRRSIYVLQRRTKTPTFLECFDFPQMGPNCTSRGEAIVATQALHLMNNGMVRDLATRFAERVRREVGDDHARQIEHIWRLAIGRRPTKRELPVLTDAFLRLTAEWQEQIKRSPTTVGKVDNPAHMGLINFCHAVFNSASFLYVD